MKKGQKIFLFLIAIAAVIPVLIVLLIYHKYGFCKIEEIWYEDSLIDYWGVIIGAAPTVVFAALTYRQTEKIYHMQDSWTRENTKRPFFIIDQVTANEDETLKCKDNCYEGGFFDEEIYQPEDQERDRDIHTLKVHDISEQTIPESDIPDNEKNTKNKERRKE